MHCWSCDLVLILFSGVKVYLLWCQDILVPHLHIFWLITYFWLTLIDFIIRSLKVTEFQGHNVLMLYNIVQDEYSCVTWSNLCTHPWKLCRVMNCSFVLYSIVDLLMKSLFWVSSGWLCKPPKAECFLQLVVEKKAEGKLSDFEE